MPIRPLYEEMGVNRLRESGVLRRDTSATPVLNTAVATRALNLDQWVGVWYEGVHYRVKRRGTWALGAEAQLLHMQLDAVRRREERDGATEATVRQALTLCERANDILARALEPAQRVPRWLMRLLRRHPFRDCTPADTARLLAFFLMSRMRSTVRLPDPHDVSGAAPLPPLS